MLLSDKRIKVQYSSVNGGGMREREATPLSLSALFLIAILLFFISVLKREVREGGTRLNEPLVAILLRGRSLLYLQGVLCRARGRSYTQAPEGEIPPACQPKTETEDLLKGQVDEVR
jgi:hypothetical protein